jgi:hypothetical protein
MLPSKQAVHNLVLHVNSQHIMRLNVAYKRPTFVL